MAEYRQQDLAYVASVFPEVEAIRSESLRQAVLEIWVDVWQESGWDRIEDCPKNPSNLPDDKKLYQHIRSVTQQALATARIVEEVHGLSFDADLLVAGGLLHDVSKLVEYEPSSVGARKSTRGRLIQHAVYGAHKAWEKKLPDELVHLIVSHTDNSGTKPATWECVLLHYVDYLDSDALLLQAGQRLLLAE